MLRKIGLTMMVAVALLGVGLPARAEHVLGINGTSFSQGGIKVTKVFPNSNATQLGLEVDDLIVALGNPAGGADMAVPETVTDISNMMLHCGDFLVMVVFKKKTSHLDIAQGPLTADKEVSLPFGDDDSADATVTVAATKGKQKVTGKTVKEVLKNQEDPGRKNVKVGKVTHLKVHKTLLNNTNAKGTGAAKDKGKDKEKGKGKKPTKPGSGKKSQVLDLLENEVF